MSGQLTLWPALPQPRAWAMASRKALTSAAFSLVGAVAGAVDVSAQDGVPW